MKILPCPKLRLRTVEIPFLHLDHLSNYRNVVSLFQSGRQYNIKQIKFGRYIDDLIAGNVRSKNSYLAVQNIKKALPQLQVNYFWNFFVMTELFNGLLTRV